MASSPLELPQMPPALKPLLGILKAASDHEKVDPVVTYWCRLYAFQLGLGIEKKAPECLNFLTTIMAWLEKEKQVHKNNEAISNELVAHAHIENHAMKLFERADAEDRSGKAGRNTIKLFFTASQLFDTLGVFGEPSEETVQKSKYAKWRAAYITRCLRNNETPLPPEDKEEAGDEAAGTSEGNYPSGPSQYTFQDENAPSQNTPGYPPNDYARQPFYPQPPQPPQTPTQPPSGPPKQSSPPGQPRPGASYPPPIPPSNTVQPTPPPSSSSTASTGHGAAALNGALLQPEAILKAQKYCKYAGSALQYEDINTAVSNLEKALSLLKTGQSS